MVLGCSLTTIPVSTLIFLFVNLLYFGCARKIYLLIYLYRLFQTNLVEEKGNDNEEEKNLWQPCKRTLYVIFTNHHDEFSLSEWQNMHPNQYEDYISCRYVL